MPDTYFLNHKVIRCNDTGEVCVGYTSYLESKHWKEMRKNLISKESVCSKCGAKGVLQLHHLTYDRIGHERKSDFLILCPSCHKKEHQKKKKKKNRKSKSKKPSVFAKSIQMKEFIPSVDETCSHCFYKELENRHKCELGFCNCAGKKCKYYKKN